MTTIPNIELSEAKIKQTVDDEIKRFSSDSQRVSDVSLLSVYLHTSRSRLVGMWLFLVSFPHLTAYIDQKTDELQGLYDLAETRINSSGLDCSSSQSPDAVGQGGN